MYRITRVARSRVRRSAIGVALVAVVFGVAAGSAGAAGTSGAPFIAPGSKVSEVGSTIPGNGDVNPYGVVVVTTNEGALKSGDVIVSNFNDGPGPTGFQGLGTTIVELNPRQESDTPPQVFAQIDPNNLPGPCPGGVGLTTALTILPGGWVVVGSLPTSDGSTLTGTGCLLVLNKWGQVVETFSGGNIDGAWDMTSTSDGPFSDLFFTNVLNGIVPGTATSANEGTVVRDTLYTPPSGPPILLTSTVIGNGFAEELNSSALVIGPTGVTLGRNGDLYVADTVNSQIDVIPEAVSRSGSAGTGTTISSGNDLNGPLGMTTTPNGDLLAVNGGDDNLVALSPTGTQLGEKAITSGGGGSLFGVAVSGGHLFFVDDSENQLNELS